MAAAKMLRGPDRTHEDFRREARRRGVTIDEVTVERLAAPAGNVGPQVLDQVHEILADPLDLWQPAAQP